MARLSSQAGANARKRVTASYIGAGVVSGGWHLSDLLDANYEAGRFRLRSNDYADEAAFNTAANLTKSGATRVTTQPYLDPTLTNLLSSLASAQTAFGTGAAVAQVGGEIELTSGGSLNGFRQPLAGTSVKAYRMRATGRRGTSTNQFNMVGSAANNQLNLGTSPASPLNTTGPVTLEAEMGASGAATEYFGFRNTSGSGTGTAYFSDFELIEAWPFQGFQQGAIGGYLKFTAPAAAVADEVLLQLDANNELDRIRFVRLVADDTLHMIVTKNNTQVADVSLGVVADSTQHEVAFSVATNDFRASMDGGVPVSDSSGGCPGVTRLRIGRSFTGNTFTGSIERVVLF